MAKAPNVVKQALLDARRKKAVSIFGFWMRALYILVRIVPVSWILNVQTIGKSRREEQMKRIEKGTPGYLDYKKKVEIIRTVIYFLLVAAIFTLGYVQTKTRSNLLTVVAILAVFLPQKRWWELSPGFLMLL